MDFVTTTPSSIQVLTNSIASPITTVKMEDLEQSTMASLAAASSPAPSSVTPSEAKPPVKKRKSWGQQLPEPKTNLPPRKRAKTEDEKEQRRIERVKRNRLAAHNSRERKRLEVEKLDTEKRRLESMVSQLQEQMRQKDALLQAYQTMHGPIAGDEFKFTPALTVSDMEGTSPAGLDSQHTMSLPALSSAAPSIIDSPSTRTFSQPATPATPALRLEADATQHSAAMLWPDLQCRSPSMDGKAARTRPTPSVPSLSATHCIQIVLTVLMTLQSLSTWTSISSLLPTRQPTSPSRRPSARSSATLFSTAFPRHLLPTLSSLRPSLLTTLLPMLLSRSPMTPPSTPSSTSPLTLARRTLRLSTLRARIATGLARTQSRRGVKDALTGAERAALAGVARWWERSRMNRWDAEMDGRGHGAGRLERQVKASVRRIDGRQRRRRRRDPLMFKGVTGVGTTHGMG